MSRAINHVNLIDEAGKIYCRKLDRPVVFDEYHVSDQCNNCSMFNGTAQGQGVECEWADSRPVGNPHIVTNAMEEFLDIQNHQADRPNVTLNVKNKK